MDIILEGDCTCCKEIYYKATKQDASIGMATVYRMVHALEEIGALNRNGQFEIMDCDSWCDQDCQLEFDDGTILVLPAEKWRDVIQAGLKQCGYGQEKNVTYIRFFNGSPE